MLCVEFPPVQYIDFSELIYVWKLLPLWLMNTLTYR